MILVCFQLAFHTLDYEVLLSNRECIGFSETVLNEANAVYQRKEVFCFTS